MSVSSSGRLWLLPVGVMLVMCSVAAAGPQPPRPTVPPPADPPKTELKIFQLENADAQEMTQVVRLLVDESTTMVSDPRTNSLIVRASRPDQFELIEALLIRLDSDSAAGDAAPDTQTRLLTFELNQTDWADELLKQLGQNLVQVIDWDRQVMVVRGTQAQVDAFTAQVRELKELEKASRASVTGTPSMLRVAWLMSGMDDQYTKPVPETMEPAVAALSHVGIDGLRLVTQVLISAGDSVAPFQSEGTLHVPNEVRMSLRGVMKHGQIQIDLQTQESSPRRAQGDAPGASSEPAAAAESFNSQLSVMVTLQPGQLAVLGSTPCGTHDSVFVIQLVE